MKTGFVVAHMNYGKRKGARREKNSTTGFRPWMNICPWSRKMGRVRPVPPLWLRIPKILSLIAGYNMMRKVIRSEGLVNASEADMMALFGRLLGVLIEKGPG